MSQSTTDHTSAAPAEGSVDTTPGTRRERISTSVAHLVHVIRYSDDAEVEQAVLRLSQTRRWLAPLALIVGAFLMLFQGMKLLLTNWRLTLVQILPAMWLWLAMLDLKAHVLHGRQFHVLRGPVLIPAVLAVTALTAVGFYLNGVFAFAIARPGRPEIRPAFGLARQHLRIILSWGIGVGLALSWSTLIVTRWSPWRFAVAQSVVVGIMMLCYVAVPSRIVGLKQERSRRDNLAASAVGAAVGAVVCSPPYIIGRVGIVMLGSHTLFWLGVALLVIGGSLQMGVTGAVKAVKVSAKLIGTPNSAGTGTAPAAEV